MTGIRLNMVKEVLIPAPEELAYDIAHPTDDGSDSETGTSSTKQNYLLETYLANSRAED